MVRRKGQATPVRWGSVSLRLSTVSVVLLVAAALAVGYLFDRGRSEALRQRELEHLRLHAERGADEFAHLARRLQRDVLFLSATPPIDGIRRALEGGGTDRVGGSSLAQWEGRLQQIFLAFAEARPEYAQLRLIGTVDGGRELVRVDRTAEGLRITPADGLQAKGDRYYFQEASRLAPGAVYFSRTDLNQEQGVISTPLQPTLRVATPVHDATGDLFAVVVLNMDMGQAFERVASYQDPAETLYIVDERGDFLLHPDPSVAFAFEFGEPFRLADAFPDHAERILAVRPGGGTYFELPGDDGARLAYATMRDFDPSDATRRLIVILTEPTDQLLEAVHLMRRESLIAMGGLLLLAAALLIIVVRRQTRSLRALASASETIAAGDYSVELPREDGSEIGSLVRAFRHMSAEVERRVEALAELNRNLEERVRERTRELSSQHHLQRLILESIADGVVVADRDGNFLLWNGKAEQIIGSGPEKVPPERWSDHFGVFRDESGELLAMDELPLVRAIRGESTVNAELYLRHPRRSEGHWIQVTARPLRDAQGQISGAVAVLVDVTEQKRLQAHLEGHRAELVKFGRLVLGAEIASTAAHQLSQPVAAICNYAGAAIRLHEQGRLGEPELGRVLARIERLSTQSGEILDRLRARIRRRERLNTDVDVNAVVASSLEFLRERIGRQGVKLECRYGTALPTIRGDPIELEHAVIQLGSNALDALEGTAQKERRLWIRTSHDPDAGSVRIEIRDTGPGVKAGIASRMFDPWETEKPGALGIGLSIAQTIVEAFGGRIRMERAAPRGALFRIDLPVPVEERS